MTWFVHLIYHPLCKKSYQRHYSTGLQAHSSPSPSTLVFKPISAVAHLRLNTKPELTDFSLPKIFLTLVFDEIAVSLAKNQVSLEFHKFFILITSFHILQILKDGYQRYHEKGISGEMLSGDIFLRSGHLEANGKSTPEIRRRLAMATTRLTKMISIWKGQCKKTKLRVLETVVFPTALYGCEAWTINNTDAKKITSFEMKCYRKILRISWMEKVTNKEVLSRLDMKTTMLLQKAKALKLKYFGHIKRHETLERHILEARIDGRRGRGRPTRRWEQDINDWMDMTTTQAGRLAEDRILFRQKVQEATSRQEISWSRERERGHPQSTLTLLNDGTTKSYL